MRVVSMDFPAALCKKPDTILGEATGGTNAAHPIRRGSVSGLGNIEVFADLLGGEINDFKMAYQAATLHSADSSRTSRITS